MINEIKKILVKFNFQLLILENLEIINNSK